MLDTENLNDIVERIKSVAYTQKLLDKKIVERAELVLKDGAQELTEEQAADMTSVIEHFKRPVVSKQPAGTTINYEFRIRDNVSWKVTSLKCFLWVLNKLNFKSKKGFITINLIANIDVE